MKEIKASDLRIGNWIFWDIPEKTNVIHEVVGIRNYTPMTIPISLGNNINDYKPIPLTEEWLERFGFEKTEWDNNNSFRKMIGKNEYTIVFYSNCHCEIGDVICKNIEHVHTLQNLYYALTGEELTINN